MLRALMNIEGFAIDATDGPFGHVRDFYFDEEAWVIRYLVVETGKRLSKPKVLVSSLSMDAVDWELDKVPVRLTCEQLRKGQNTAAAPPRKTETAKKSMPYTAGGRRLRSCNAFIGYQVQAADGELGDVQGMLVDEKCWAIRYLIVNTGDWWQGHQVLVATDWLSDVSWLEEKVMIGSTRQASKEALVYQHYGRNCSWQYETQGPIASHLRPSDARGTH